MKPTPEAATPLPLKGAPSMDRQSRIHVGSLVSAPTTKASLAT